MAKQYTTPVANEVVVNVQGNLLPDEGETQVGLIPVGEPQTMRMLRGEQVQLSPVISEMLKSWAKTDGMTRTVSRDQWEKDLYGRQ